MHLGPRRTAALIRDALARGSFVVCHRMLTYGNHPGYGPAICRGFFDGYSDQSFALILLRACRLLIEATPRPARMTVRPAILRRLRQILRAEQPHQEEIVPAVWVQFGLPADAFLAEPAGPVAADGAVIAGQDLQFDAVHAQRIERPRQHQFRDLPAEPPAAQASREQAHCAGGAVPAGVHPQPGAADAPALALDGPGVATGLGRPGTRGQVLAAVVAAAVPLPPPR
jgi:hypothetical protein